MRRSISKYGARWLLATLLTLLAVASAKDVLPNKVVERIDLFIYDMRMRVLPTTLDQRIVIVNIDEKSLAEVGRWPWSRDITAELVRQLNQRYQVKAIGFDVSFPEPDTSSGYRTLEELANGELKNLPDFATRIQALKPALDYDGRLAKAFQGKPVVLGYYLYDKPSKGLLPDAAFTTTDLNGHALGALSTSGYEANLPELQRAARAGGFFNAELDPDGILRSSPLMARVGSGYYESLALATARVALGATRIRPLAQNTTELDSVEAIGLNTVPRQTRIPVEHKLMTLIQFRGKGGQEGGAFRYISAVDVLKGRTPLAELSQRIVLVGTTAAGLNDLRATPVKPDYPGVEVHANIIASILDGDVKQRPDFSSGFDLLQVILIGILLGALLPRLAPAYSILLALATATSIGALNFWLYQSANLVLPIATVLLLVLALSVSDLAWGYLFEHRKRHAMANLFGEYVAPELVAEMAENPESYQMEGESRELTVLFADVRGFTAISEELTPRALREYINPYLTVMSENIRGNFGTLDKYIGDAVMAFWGAPVALPDHASRAVATALQMQASAATLNQDFIRRGLPPLHIGIGLTTGQMHVGDMGSKIRRAYTVMGDVVNLSSRLEGITKVYGVGIVVGEETRRAAPEFAYRELDRVRVKGKQKPVPIFEPLALDSAIDPELRNALAQWHDALGLIRSMSWDQAEIAVQELHRRYPADALYLFYLQRIAHYRERPPPPDWDGVTVYDSK